MSLTQFEPSRISVDSEEYKNIREHLIQWITNCEQNSSYNEEEKVFRLEDIKYLTNPDNPNNLLEFIHKIQNIFSQNVNNLYSIVNPEIDTKKTIKSTSECVNHLLLSNQEISGVEFTQCYTINKYNRNTSAGKISRHNSDAFDGITIDTNKEISHVILYYNMDLTPPLN